MPDPIAPTLPAGWADLLDDIGRRLDAAVEAVALPEPTVATTSPQRSQELAGLADRLRELQARADAAAARVAEIDAALQAAEVALSQRQAATESVRHRLAAWVYRAIG